MMLGDPRSSGPTTVGAGRGGRPDGIDALDADALAADAVAELEVDGVVAVLGTVVNPAGLTLAKVVPLRRLGAFVDPGLGASPSWHAFAIDQLGIVLGESTGVIGDQRIRLDLGALRSLGDGLAWAPCSFFDQDGSPDPYCTRGTLGRIEAKLAAAGIDARVGHEMEFVLVGPRGERLPSHMWTQYGLAGLLEHEEFVLEVIEAASRCGVDLEQFHPEYGAEQFEISLPPLAPVAAADQLTVLRIIVGRVARRHDLRMSLSPVPFAGGAGSGAHQHVSLTRGGHPLFGDEAHPGDMTADGASAVAGLLGGLRAAQGILCGSILSGFRLAPGQWSGAFICWGTENREAAIRFVRAGPANPHGANVEVKVIDPSANTYLATATVLGLALDGIERSLVAPSEVAVDPSTLTESERAAAGIALLTTHQSEAVDALDASSLLRGILGDPAVDSVVGVRRYEQTTYGELEPDQLAERFRLAWSV